MAPLSNFRRPPVGGARRRIRADGRETQSVTETANLSGIKVMVIDDSNTIRRSAEIFLVQAGCKVILAEDGFDALAKITDHQPDVIFCDIMMPRLDGMTFVKANKRNEGTS